MGNRRADEGYWMLAFENVGGRNSDIHALEDCDIYLRFKPCVSYEEAHRIKNMLNGVVDELAYAEVDYRSLIRHSGAIC
jgi:hypothetical protein